MMRIVCHDERGACRVVVSSRKLVRAEMHHLSARNTRADKAIHMLKSYTAIYPTLANEGHAIHNRSTAARASLNRLPKMVF